jgi:hypothetical protein
MSCYTSLVFNTPFGQLSGNKIGSLYFLAGQFRVGMKMPPDKRDLLQISPG